jgi:transposase-like protein
MPAERTIMRQVREVLRLKFVGGVPIREIARRIGVAASTVRATIRRFQAAGLSWPLPEEMTDAVLEAKLFADAGTKQGHRRQVEPDWASIHRELKRKHVTLSILWDEYVERNPEGYRYSRFCELYRSWEGKLSVTMRQTHVGGDTASGSEGPFAWGRRPTFSKRHANCNWLTGVSDLASGEHIVRLRLFPIKPEANNAENRAAAADPNDRRVLSYGGSTSAGCSSSFRSWLEGIRSSRFWNSPRVSRGHLFGVGGPTRSGNRRAVAHTRRPSVADNLLTRKRDR